MSTIVFSGVPAFLESEFNRSVDSDGGICTADDQNFTINDSIKSAQDLRHILHVINFWGVDKIPVGVIDYCYRTDVFVWESTISQVQDNQSAFRAAALLSVFNDASRGSIIERAIYAGRIEILEYLVRVVDSKDDSAQNAIAIACGKGRLDCVKVLHKAGFPWGDAVLVSAAGGHLDCLQYVHDNRCAWPESGPNKLDACAVAALNGHLQCLRFAHKNGSNWDLNTLLKAAAGGHLECLVYGYEEGLKWPSELCNVAVRHGHLECLQYAHTQGCPWDATATLTAVKHGHANCLQYLLQAGCVVHPEASVEAASGGHLRCLQALHSHSSTNVVWDIHVTAAAARGGHLRCLEYLHEQNCPWDASTTSAAAKFNRNHILEYAFAQGCPKGI